MQTQYLSLSLFIILLSFFVILTSNSNFTPDKTKEVLSSVSKAFSSVSLSIETARSFQADIAESFRVGDTLDRIEGLFRSQIPAVTAKKSRLGNKMHVRLTVDDFESRLMMTLPGQSQSVSAFGQESFTKTLVGLVQSEETIPYEMDIIMNIADKPAHIQNEFPGDAENLITRVSLYAQMLEDAGLSRKQMSIGLGQSTPGTVDLFFSPYVPLNRQVQAGEINE